MLEPGLLTLLRQHDPGVPPTDPGVPQTPPVPPKTTAETANWLPVYFLLAIILLALTPIAIYESPKSFFLVLAYLASLTLVKVWVKETMDLGFPYPDCITSLHMVTVCCVALLFERPLQQEATQVLPISLLNGFSLLTSNQSLFFGGVAFVSIISANMPIITFLLELLRGRRALGLPSALGVFVVCVGGGFCVKGTHDASWAAFLLATLATTLRSLRAVWQHELLTVSLSPMRLVFWNGFWSLVLSLAMMAAGEGFGGFSALSHQALPPKALQSLLLSMMAAAFHNITQWYAIRQVGALMSSIIGNLNLILVIALSTAWLNETVSLQQYGGVTLLALGTILKLASFRKLLECRERPRKGRKYEGNARKTHGNGRKP